MGKTFMCVAYLIFFIILVGTASCSSSLRDISEEYSKEQGLLKNVVKSVRHIVRIRDPATNMPYYCAFISSPPGGKPLALMNMLHLTQKTLIIINTWPKSERNFTVPNHRNCNGCENIIVFASMTDVHQLISSVAVTCMVARIELLVAIYDMIDSDDEAEKSAKTIVDFAWKQLRAHAIVLVPVGRRILALKSERHVPYIRCEPEPPRVTSHWENGTLVGNLAFTRFGYNKCVVRVASGERARDTRLIVVNGQVFIEGIEGRVVETIAEKQNYTVELMNVVVPTDELCKGMLVGKPNSITNCVRGKVVSGEAEIGVCDLFIRYWEGMKYTHSFSGSTIVLLIPIPKYRIPFASILQIFSKPVWICILVSGLVGRILIRINRRSISSLMTLALFLGVSVASEPKGFLEKSQMTLWVVYGYLITQSYIAMLASVLNNPRVHKIETLEELAATDIRVAGYSLEKECFEIDEKYKRILETYIFMTQAEVIEMLNNPDKLFLDDDTGILMEALSLRKHSCCGRYYQLKEEIVNRPIAMAIMARSRVSLNEIDRTIASLVESGLILKWSEESVLPSKSREIHFETPSPTLSLDEVAGIFVILVTGLLLSTIVFAVEVYKNKASKNTSSPKIPQIGSNWAHKRVPAIPL